MSLQQAQQKNFQVKKREQKPALWLNKEFYLIFSNYFLPKKSMIKPIEKLRITKKKQTIKILIKIRFVIY